MKNKYSFNSIVYKIIIFPVLAVSVILLAVLLIILVQANNTFSEQHIKEQQYVLDRSTTILQSYFELSTLKNIVDEVFILDNLEARSINDTELTRYFDGIVKTNEIIDAVTLHSHTGVQIASDSSRLFLEGEDFSTYDFIQNSTENGYVSSVYEDPISSHRRISYSFEIKDDSTTVGFISAHYNLDLLNQLLSRDFDNFIILLDVDGTYFLDTRGEVEVLSSADDLAETHIAKQVWDTISSSNITSGFFRHNDKIQNYNISYRAFNGLSVIVGTDSASLFPLHSILTLQILLVGAFALLLIIYVGYVVYMRVVKRIKILKETMFNHDLDLGYVQFPIEMIEANDEIGAITREYRSIVKQLSTNESNSPIDIDTVNENIHSRQMELKAQQKAILNILDDVEESKKSVEEYADNLKKYQLAVENASDQIIITDGDGLVIYVNPQYEKVTGYSKSELVGKTQGLKWGEKMSTEFYDEMWKVLRDDRKDYYGEVTNNRKDGTEYIADIRISPIIDENDEIKYFVGVERDVTKEKQIDKMKSDFISLASHQLRTPLGAMKWYLEMLLNGDMGKLEESQLDFIKEIDSSNERMISLVNGLLNISRIESGRIIIDPTMINIHSFIDGIVEEASVELEAKNQKLTVTIDDSIQEIMIDSKLMTHVYLNLIDNAIKYSPDGSTIDVKIYKKENEIFNEITDTGIGIPEEEKSDIFTRFYRSTNALKIETDGTGLGLYLVKQIVETIGGHIWFDSKEDKGTTFSFTYPIHGMEKRDGEVYLSEMD